MVSIRFISPTSRRSLITARSRISKVLHLQAARLWWRVLAVTQARFVCERCITTILAKRSVSAESAHRLRLCGRSTLPATGFAGAAAYGKDPEQRGSKGKGNGNPIKGNHAGPEAECYVVRLEISIHGSDQCGIEYGCENGRYSREYRRSLDMSV
jgi:hypothetical protein